MIVRFFIFLFTLVVILILQTTWLSSLSLWGAYPDISLLIIIFIAYKFGSIESTMVSFVFGIIEDFVTFTPLGLSSLLKTFIAFSSASVYKVVSADKIVVPILFGFFATLQKALLLFVLSLLFGSKINTYSISNNYILWLEAGMNALLCPLVFLLASWIIKLQLFNKRNS